MKRPYLVHATLFLAEETLSIRLLLGVRSHRDDYRTRKMPPWQQIKNFFNTTYHLKMVGHDIKGNPLWQKEYESDDYGEVLIKIPLLRIKDRPAVVSLYETHYVDNEEWPLGTLSPILLPYPCKVIISDFDKTLVETKFQKAQDFWNSLTHPVTDFPTLKQSLTYLTSYIQQGYIPFILSASPHFYASTIQEWAQKYNLPSINLFLKDYRKIFSLFTGKLTSKDIRKHGHYKLNELLTILIITSLPNQLVLMGDDSESDPLIYLTLVAILQPDLSPLALWESLKEHPDFQLTIAQDTLILNKIFQIKTLQERYPNSPQKIEIFIRTLDPIPKPINFPPFLQKWVSLIHFYHDTTRKE